MLTRGSRAKRFAHAFTLLELLIVIGIVALLISLMLPALNRVREQAKWIQCISNMRQLAVGLQGYAAANKHRYPPNVSLPSPGIFWYDQDRIGRHVSYTSKPGSPFPGGVFVCPNDNNSLLSYSMNVWASSAMDASVAALIPAGGRPWTCGVRNGPKMALILETWSTNGSAGAGFGAPAYCGWRGSTPGQRWGGGGGIAPPFSAGRWGPVNCEVCYLRHRNLNAANRGLQAFGRTNIAFCDTHVESFTQDQLADPTTGVATGVAYWSPSF